MDTLTTRSASRSAREESYDEMLYPSTDPTFFHDLYEVIKFEPINGLLDMWEGGYSLKHETKMQTVEHLQDFSSPTSLHSNSQEPGKPQSPKLSPVHSSSGSWPSSATQDQDHSTVLQHQCASPSTESFPDCRVSSLTCALLTQTCDTPVSKIFTDISSPPYHQEQFRGGSLAQNCLQAAESSNMDTLTDENESILEFSASMQTPMTGSQSKSEQGRAKGAPNSPPYSQLLHDAFMSSATKKLSLHQIYEWFRDNTNKATDNRGKDWRSSIRHNLSMNKVCYLLPRVPKLKVLC